MTKKKLISNIKLIIEEYGGFNTAEVEASSSPCTNSIGKHIVQLAERFGKNVELVTYDTKTDLEISSENVEYETLSNNILNEIFELAKEWKQKNAED